MNFTVRKQIDKLGRIVLPKEMRENYDIELGDDVDLIACDEGIMIVKSVKKNKKENKDCFNGKLLRLTSNGKVRRLCKRSC